MSVSVTEGDSVTLYTGVETIHQEDVKWYFKDTRIAQISGDLSKICTDVQCNKGTEQFRHRLKLDHQTGSLTITNIRTTDSGLYKLKIFSSNRDSENIFNITVRGFSSAERDKMKRKSVKERESVTFYPGVIKTNDLMTWYFFDTRIAEITGNRSYICTDVQCKDGAERFKNRLRVNLQSGSLTIIKTRITDSGVYKVNINSSNKISIIKSFSVDVIGEYHFFIQCIFPTSYYLLISINNDCQDCHCFRSVFRWKRNIRCFCCFFTHCCICCCDLQ
uniref:Immunoglobulin domain-containing protein n=1 Tax=Cyprinus carpio TaxID=7962 RepID=A0A8C1MBY7_CYPCA